MAKQRFFTYYIVSEAQGHTIIVPRSIQPPCEREKTKLIQWLRESNLGEQAPHKPTY